MTTLTTKDAVVEQTSAQAGITDLEDRQRHTASVPVLAQLVSPATYHLPLVGTWASEIGQRKLFGHIAYVHLADKIDLVGQWADYLGTQVQTTQHSCDANVLEVWCEALMDGITVRIWTYIENLPADTETPEA